MHPYDANSEAYIVDFRKLKYYRHNSLILVVSSNDQVISLIASTLSVDKYNFLTVSSGEQAWNIILEKRPAIILADWTTPDISGLALCHRVKANLDYPDLMTCHFILMMESDQPLYRQLGFETGVDEFLNIPVDVFELKIRIRSALRSSALLQSLTWTNQKLLAQNDLLDALNLSDPLTNVLTEQTFTEVFPKMVKQFQGYGEYKSYGFLSVMVVDIDHFHRVIDGYGHKIANETIKAIAGRLIQACASNSLIYRYSLDKFVCVTPHENIPCCHTIANALVSCIRSHPISVSSGLLLPLTISIGGIIMTLDKQTSQEAKDMNFESLINVALTHLQQAKQSGGDRYLVAEVALTQVS
ncbi:MAG: diguanylate cyclase [Pseudanabaenaceae cyanobacterium bins.39]|nr:diguanylate cyclase [Pseudanabaenaceae cyanobacterium bins.39]